MSPGAYPDVGLRDARTLRDHARALLTKGINPKVEDDGTPRRSGAAIQSAA